MPAYSSSDRAAFVVGTLRLALVVVVTVASASCAPTAPPAEGKPYSTPAPPSPMATPTTSSIHTEMHTARADLDATFAAAADHIAASVSVSVVSGGDVLTFASAVEGPAWSTIKVPVAIAAFRSAPEQSLEYLSAAITRSDNAAAEALWSLLGPPDAAARAVELVLQDAGDLGTVVQPERIRAGFTAFGQTDWTTEAQAAFAWRLPCIDGADAVIAEMQQIVSEQRWGFARDADAASKGGWGPASDGNYLVRQFAILRSDHGALGVAIAVAPYDGTFQSGVTAANQIADWVDENRGDFPWAKC